MCDREIIVFGSNFRNWDFDEFTCLRSLESENEFLEVDLHIYMCLSLCMFVISMQKKRIGTKQIVADIQNSMFYMRSRVNTT